MAVVNHSAKFKVCCFFCRGILTKRYKVTPGHYVLFSEEQDTVRRQTVASCTSGLLIIGIHSRGHVVVDHIANIRFVDAHSESVGGNYDPDLVIYKSFLALQPFIAVQAGMITYCAYAASAYFIAYRFNFLTR